MGGLRVRLRSTLLVDCKGTPSVCWKGMSDMFLTTAPDFGVDNPYRVIDLVMALSPARQEVGDAFRHALRLMTEAAEKMGANAIVGVHAHVGPECSMFVYGTAVMLDVGGSDGG